MVSRHSPRFARDRTEENAKLRAKFGLAGLPVVAFTWYDLFNGTNESNWRPMRNATDLKTEFATPRHAGADGIIEQVGLLAVPQHLWLFVCLQQ